nr:hypothetical protein [Asticcacaulis excentricus]
MPEADAPPDTGGWQVVFQFRVPVNVEVEDDRVTHVAVLDETPVRDARVVQGNAAYLPQALSTADDGQDGPAWRFGN